MGQLLKCLAGFALLASLVPAQSEDAVASQSERQNIERLRLSEALRLDAAEAACQTRFAVTRCMDAVRAERQRVNSALNGQEASLNAADRNRAEQEQLQRIQEKVENQRSALSSEPKESIEPKRVAKPAVAPPAGNSRDAVTPPVADPSVLTKAALQRAANVRAFNEKQIEAQARREAVAKKMQSKASAVKPLPAYP